MDTLSLIEFIESHDRCFAVEHQDGDKLIVTSDVILADGTLTQETDFIPATMGAARYWLGY